LAGTDHRRRDLMLSLLWGAPVALAFGLLAAVGTSVSTMVIAAVGVWFGGWLVILVPSYVFLEATLAFLGVSDPVLPTWGKLIVEGISHGLYTGAYHMVLEPVGLLMLTGLAFVMVGLALERIFEPRLRER
jgi:ABC-type dipeptide/oligopeptide/nickel transport system permease subunit